MSDRRTMDFTCRSIRHPTPVHGILSDDMGTAGSMIAGGLRQHILAEINFPATPFPGGFGLLTPYGIAKPAYRAFESRHKSETELLEVLGTHDTVTLHAAAAERGIGNDHTGVNAPRRA